jgi:23S rRNA-/tRNA-specific pseudouridylate synthase
MFVGNSSIRFVTSEPIVTVLCSTVQQTSGVMVFAKNEKTASSLCKAWRERDQVSKHYLAIVRDWPPYHQDKQEEGTIDVPLAPSEERLKWEVSDSGKPSVTKWKVLQTVKGDQSKGIALELQPITGRTHQLRIHCAHLGSGIIGDSLYGTDRVEFDPLNAGKQLHLPAWKLSFPHPNEQETCDFTCSPSWL